MKQLILLIISTFLLMGLQCSNPEGVNYCPDGPATFRLNAPFILCWGIGVEQAGQSGFSALFSKLIEDSRCPTDITCVRAGSATVELIFTKGTERVTDTLSIGDNVSQVPSSALFQNYQIELEDVLPAPVSGVTTPEQNYQVKLLITQ